MSKENAKQFLSEYKNNKEATDLLKEYPKAKTLDESIHNLAEVAGKMGIQVTVEEMSEAANELCAERKAQTDASVNKMQKLNDTDLENVDGGFYYVLTKDDGKRIYNKCIGDFTDTNCAFLDACNALTRYYYDCSGEMFADDGENHCSLDHSCDSTFR